MMKPLICHVLLFFTFIPIFLPLSCIMQTLVQCRTVSCMCFLLLKAFLYFGLNDRFPIRIITSRSPKKESKVKSSQKKLRPMSIVNQVSAMFQNFQLHWIRPIVICKYFHVVEEGTAT